MVRTHAKGEQKLQSKWRGPMLVKEAKSDLVFVVKDLLDAKPQTVHAQRKLLCPIAGGLPTASKVLRLQAEHYDTTYHLIDEITDIRRNKGALQVLIKWAGPDDEVDRTWEPLAQIRNDIPRILGDFLYTAGKRNLERNTLDLSYGGTFLGYNVHGALLYAVRACRTILSYGLKIHY